MAENEKSSEISGEDVQKSTPKPSPSKSTGKSMKYVISLFRCFFFSFVRSFDLVRIPLNCTKFSYKDFIVNFIGKMPKYFTLATSVSFEDRISIFDKFITLDVLQKLYGNFAKEEKRGEKS